MSHSSPRREARTSARNAPLVHEGRSPLFARDALLAARGARSDPAAKGRAASDMDGLRRLRSHHSASPSLASPQPPPQPRPIPCATRPVDERAHVPDVVGHAPATSLGSSATPPDVVGHAIADCCRVTACLCMCRLSQCMCQSESVSLCLSEAVSVCLLVCLFICHLSD